MKRRGIPPREREAIVRAWGGKCAYCKGTQEPFAVDHIVPFAEGGTCDLENLCLACVQCNSMKSDVRLPEMYEGLLLGIAKRKAKSICRKVRRKSVNTPKNNKKGDELKLPTDCGGEWIFPYLENANKIVTLLEALFSKGMSEEVTRRGDLLPDVVTTTSEVLDKDFFDDIEISYDESCGFFSTVIHQLVNDAGCRMSNLGWSGIRNGDNYIIRFNKPKDEVIDFLCFVKRSIVVYEERSKEIR